MARTLYSSLSPSRWLPLLSLSLSLSACILGDVLHVVSFLVLPHSLLQSCCLVPCCLSDSFSSHSFCLSLSPSLLPFLLLLPLLPLSLPLFSSIQLPQIFPFCSPSLAACSFPPSLDAASSLSFCSSDGARAAAETAAAVAAKAAQVVKYRSPSPAASLSPESRLRV